MFYFFLSLAVLLIISQTIHTYYVFDSFSKLEGKIKTIQAVLFCSVISLSILAFVLAGNIKLAIFGAIIEVIINIYYYAVDFWKDGFKTRTNHTRKDSIQRFWRQNWIAILFGVLLPVFIYIFSEQMIKFK